jgi:hypothetical protein
VLLTGLALSACADDGDRAVEPDGASVSGEGTGSQPSDRREPFRYPPPPSAPAPDAPSPTAAVDAIDRLLTGIEEGRFDYIAVGDLAAAGDPRHAWLVADLARFFGADEALALRTAFGQLTGAGLDGDPDADRSVWLSATNHLIAWDTPAYPDLPADKARLLLQIEPRWEPLITDADADIDWRHLGWGGVLIDDRPLGDPDPCPQGCIPALDDPAVTPAAQGDWYDDDRIVFGVVEGGEALAIPLHIAEVHEMFNVTLGGRRIAVPYCTLCGSAQAYRTDTVDADRPLVLRTSGLLSRSNKVMYDLGTQSVFDTFTGAAVSGPLQDRAVVLEELTVVRSTWGEWKAAHPATSIVAEDGGIGRLYPDDPLRGRDDDGPIFPVGAIDERLPAHELVVGVITAGGDAVAFPSDAASTALSAGGDVVAGEVQLSADGDGLRALDAATGAELVAHEAFWFAWSQFHPDTELWVR